MAGAMSVTNAVWSRLTVTAPDVVVAVTGLVPATLVIVPGKVCAGAKAITPVCPIERIVGVGAPAPF